MNNLNLGFIGLGLIGGSLAKTFKRIYPDCIITAFDTDTTSLAKAFEDNIVDTTVSAVDEHFSKCNYIFLCTPVEFNAQYLRALKEIISSDCIITDVGSVKTHIHNTVKELSLEHTFIGGHPMAGSEKSGYKNSTDQLLVNAYYAITPTDKISNDKLDTFVALIKSIECIPLVLDCQKHDFSVAGISHLPHIIASSLVNCVKDNDYEDETMKLLAAGGFKDITRIASSSPIMWQQICTTNSEAISRILNNYIDSLMQIKNDIDSKNANNLTEMFDSSKNYRDSINTTTKGLIQKSYAVYCDIIDEEGAIATIATILAINHISIKNIGIIHNREYEEGVLKIEFYDDEAVHKTVALLDKHRYTVHNVIA
ncbi:MAG: prephenate dehydrogenase [Lachnospira sp.]|nr:prephenate dehydrogenase [Lachnospira sp.]